jgi:hypothetical protein
VEAQLLQVQRDVPLQFEVVSDHVDWTKCGEWLLEMRRLSDLHRKHLPFIERIERFSQYRIGHTAVYCNFFQGRDRDGPSELIIKSKKKVRVLLALCLYAHAFFRCLPFGRARWSASRSCARRC